MIKLYDNALSPFARKARIALELKGIEHTAVDGLALSNHEVLKAVNGRVEVPALEHDGVIVVGSSDILAYLDREFADRPLFPSDRREWVHTRAWERCSDTVVDAILTNISYWHWAKRSDSIPDGLRERAAEDMEVVYAALERDLDGRDFLGGETPMAADISLFPHIGATRMLGVPYDAKRYPALHAWAKRSRGVPEFAADLARVMAFIGQAASAGDHEREKIFWRGDRIEWILARGFDGWFREEIDEDRVLWPGLGVPGPR